MREVIKEAKNVEEALDLCCEALGVERGDIKFEIITLPKRGFLGLRNTPAKVRVYLEEPEAPVAKPQPKPQPRPEPRPEPKPVQREERPAPRPRVEPVVKEEPKAEPISQAAAEPEKLHEETVPSAPLKFVPAETVDGKAKTASDYVKAVLAEMGVAAEISVAFTESGIVLRLSGDGLGVIIGRRGETLDSLQYLAGLVANRQEGDYMRVTIDSGNYRQKRERTLEQLAKKLSASVVRFGRPSTLEPMNPYERRIIHATVSKIEGVTSASIGEEANRRVVISPTNPKPQQNRAPRSNNFNRGPRPAGNRDSRPPRAPREGGFSNPPREGAAPEPPRESGVSNQPRESGISNQPRENGFSNPPREGGFRDNRPPRRDNREFHARSPQEGAARVTPTTLDREYAKEIERNAPAFVAAEPSEKPVVREVVQTSRTKAPKEADDLPLYGKIEL